MSVNVTGLINPTQRHQKCNFYFKSLFTGRDTKHIFPFRPIIRIQSPTALDFKPPSRHTNAIRLLPMSVDTALRMI